jgi:hypothetical protein
MMDETRPTSGLTAAECLAALEVLRDDPRCRRCECLDWALSQLQLVADYDLACEAASLRQAPERIHPEPGCRPCPPLDTVLAWLQSGRHTAEM